MTYGAARGLLYESWIDSNRKMVEQASEGKLAYLHIRGMNWPSFQRFEREIYAVGAGKEGLIIDVRENGGGFTTDHLLTILMPETHAITVPRGGGPGYPHDRRVYATWRRPVAVLCNQNSFSNAEIFSHAIKTLKRGRLIGVPTAGGVISTGGTSILDVGFLRIPFRGWFVAESGEDMELNGAVPDDILWPQPGEWPAGRDAQLQKAIEVLAEDVEAWKARPRPELRKSSERYDRPVRRGRF
jgi:tricorn protease